MWDIGKNPGIGCQQSLSLIGRPPTIIDYLNIWERPAIAAVGLTAEYLHTFVG